MNYHVELNFNWKNSKNTQRNAWKCYSMAKHHKFQIPK